MSQIHDAIRATIAKAEARALRAHAKRAAAEDERHRKRVEELSAECAAEVRKTRAVLALLPAEDGAALPSAEQEAPA